METSGGRVRERTVEWLNGLAETEAAGELRACCSADPWVEAMTRGRPYPSLEALLTTSTAVIGELDDAALAQALSAHARIGERRAGRTREDGWSRTEQAAALAAPHDLAAALAEGNREYEARFGRVFLIRAARRSAQDMYDALRTRLANDPDTERALVLHELAEITNLRLTDLVPR